MPWVSPGLAEADTAPAERPRNREPRCIFSVTESVCSPEFLGMGSLDCVFLQLVFYQGCYQTTVTLREKSISAFCWFSCSHTRTRGSVLSSLFIFTSWSLSQLCVHWLPSQPLLEMDSVTGLVVLSSPMEPASDARVPDFVQLFAMGIVHHFWSLTFFT